MRLALRARTSSWPGDGTPLHAEAGDTTAVATFPYSLSSKLRPREPPQGTTEAHRFGLGHHRRARSRRTLRSPLLAVPGLGPASVKRLLAVFGNGEDVLAASPEALAAAAGKAVAARIERFRASSGGDRR